MTRGWVIVAAGLAVFMASVDLSITNVEPALAVYSDKLTLPISCTDH